MKQLTEIQPGAMVTTVDGGKYPVVGVNPTYQGVTRIQYHQEDGTLKNCNLPEVQIDSIRRFTKAEREKYTVKYKIIYPINSLQMIGTDPEVFVRRDGGNGEVLPAFNFLPNKPKKGYGYAFWDGFQGEFTTLPRTCLEGLTLGVHLGLEAIHEAAIAKDPTARLVLDSCVEITPKILNETKPEHLQLGCAPSANAYDEMSVLLENPQQMPFRSAGCHMHFSHAWMNPQVAPRIVRFLDATLGVMLVSVGQGWNDPRRRQMYGRAGEYRVGKTLEYRPPDVAPMLCHPAVFNLMWDFARIVVRLGMQQCDYIWDADPDEVREAMNRYDVPLAQKILRRNEEVMRNMFRSVYSSPTFPAIHKTIYEGFQSVVRDPKDVTRNWQIPTVTDGFGGAWRTAAPYIAAGGML